MRIKLLAKTILLTLALALTSCGVDSSTSSRSDTSDEGKTSSETTNEETTTSSEETTTSSEETSQGGLETTSLPDDPAGGFVFHFEKKGADYNKYYLWLWATGKDGADYKFNGLDDYGAYAKYSWKDFTSAGTPVDVSFIVKDGPGWNNVNKDPDGDRTITIKDYTPNEAKYYHIYLKTNDKTIYVSADGKVNDIVKDFMLTYNDVLDQLKIYFLTNKPYSKFTIFKNGSIFLESSTLSSTDANILSLSNTKLVYLIDKTKTDVKDVFTLDITFQVSGATLTKTCDNGAIFNTAEFNATYNYNGELGASYTVDNTTFRVWSPVSSIIKLRIYDNGTPVAVSATKGDDTYKEYDMTLGDFGVFSTTVEGDLAGKYYTYVVTNSSFENQEIVDPYAKSTGIDGLRGMIVDFSKTNPTGWDEVKINEYNPSDLVVYETHIADLTSSSTWGGTAQNAKLYEGFHQSGTKYHQVTTGFDHIKDLNVNAVQIIPIFDQANNELPDADRTDGTKREFNWGYNPLNYNALDGIYSANPYDGYTKIREFKSLVKDYVNSGINIIMDVVYNHVSGLTGCNFDVLMPHYYFRYTSVGPSNGSGCGNETASERPMFRKFMIESTQFWASEYKLGGFRFDLMGLHDLETMNQLTANLHDNVSPFVRVYGEPWTGGDSALKTISAAQSSINKYEGFGSFNDKMRDALIKGGLSDSTEKGWIDETDYPSSLGDIQSGIAGKVFSSSTVYESEKCINYVTCHDNYTLYDRFKAAGIRADNQIEQMNQLANAVVFTSQGTSFMLAGEEFLRSKQGISNSYSSSYEINTLDYSLKEQHQSLFNNYRALIQLKTKSKYFSLSNAECTNIKFEVGEDSNYISYSFTINNSSIKVAHANGYKSSTLGSIDFSGYSVLVDTLGIYATLSSATKLNAFQTIVAIK